MAAGQALSNVAEFTVSELSSAVKQAVEENFGYVRVRGEVSGFRGAHSSGHAYFALKDASAKLEAVIWRGQFSKLKFKPEEGLEVIATGKLTTYPGSSKYQIVIERLEPSGLGALMALLEERRKKFAAEGLFALERKKALPRLPLSIGIITSPTGAVIRDMLHRIADRFPVNVVVWPVRVQGETAAEEVAQAIAGFNGMASKPDLIIVARGGGSIEDLWAFNEEIVVRAASASMLPLISAIGHETDWTLLDHVADLRAPTPTAAIELALQVRQELIVQLSQFGTRSLRAKLQMIERMKKHLASLQRALPKLDALLALPRQKLDHAGERLPRAAIALYQQKRLRMARTAQRLSMPMLKLRLTRTHERISDMKRRMARAMITEIKRQRAGLNNLEKLLSSLSYRNVLSRGYAVVRSHDAILTRSAQVKANQSLQIEFADGLVPVLSEGKGGAPADLFGNQTKKR